MERQSTLIRKEGSAARTTAAAAARMFKPRILYPYHQGSSDPADVKALLADLKETEVRVRELP